MTRILEKQAEEEKKGVHEGKIFQTPEYTRENLEKDYVTDNAEEKKKANCRN
jgi:hypothetical protein